MVFTGKPTRLRKSKKSFQEPFIKKRVKVEKLLRFAWPSWISSKINQKTCQNLKGYFDLRGLVGFPRKAFQNLVKIQKFASICELWLDFLQKPFENVSKFKRLLRFAWPSWISSKNHSKPGKKFKSLLRFAWPSWISCKNNSKADQNWKGCFDLRGLLGFLAKSIQNLVKI